MDRRGWSELLPVVQRVLGRLETLLPGSDRDPPRSEDPDPWAYRWRRDRLEAVHRLDLFELETLIGVERSVLRLRVNLEAFVSGAPALDTLLYGDRGTGKSSAVRGLLGEFGSAGLRLVEVRPHDLVSLPEVIEGLQGFKGRFVLYSDDLAFEEADPAYRELKSALEGGLERRPENVLIVATSNRRHLVPERAWENALPQAGAEDLHPDETREDKLGLFDRFGLLLPFFRFDQPTYLRIVDHYAETLGLAGRMPREDLHRRALRFALERGSRSGRAARQFCVLALQETGAGA